MTEHPSQRVTIIATGEELLWGKTPDTNSAHIAARLGAHGLSLIHI